ncbi:GDSL-type esterase/lipase family protein [Ruminococcaceae bacterium OttesenSCG-928-A11]|nr:GDSL-type esterase/lipase family protein [Ruminococcaceae bacterium OttesenSCG-928-A11]
MTIWKQKSKTAQTEYPHSLFAVAHTDIGAMPFNNHGRTLRLVVPCNVDAHAMQVRFANLHSPCALPVGAASLALCDEHGVLAPDTLVPLTVGGKLSFELAPGEEILSDRADFAPKAGSSFALNLYYPTENRVHSGNWVGRGGLRSRPGNFSADLTLPGPGLVSRVARTVIATDMTVTITTVKDIVAFCQKPAMVVGCLGDSVTQQGNWTGALEKLLHHHYPGKISLCNLGISGNRLLADSPPAQNGLLGIAGVNRFERDLLPLSGLTHAVLALGANDVGLPGSEGLPVTDIPDTTLYTDTLRRMADALHSRGVFVICATITPRWVSGHFTETAEYIRQGWNEWIREADCFDAVFDWDKVVRRADGTPGMKDKYHLPDGLHPSPLAGVMMAKSVDLGLFAKGYGEGGNG